jgi:hypothetical protein
MSLKFETAKWNVEITWEQMTLTPLGTAPGHGDANPENTSGLVQTTNTNYFLFNLIEQLFAPGHKQEHSS